MLGIWKALRFRAQQAVRAHRSCVLHGMRDVRFRMPAETRDHHGARRTRCLCAGGRPPVVRRVREVHVLLSDPRYRHTLGLIIRVRARAGWSRLPGEAWRAHPHARLTSVFLGARVALALETKDLFWLAGSSACANMNGRLQSCLRMIGWGADVGNARGWRRPDRFGGSAHDPAGGEIDAHAKLGGRYAARAGHGSFRPGFA